MSTNTTNYNLIKLSQTDFYNVDDFNGNMDIIDTKMKEISLNSEIVAPDGTKYKWGIDNTGMYLQEV